MNLFALEGDPKRDLVDWRASAKAHDDLRVSKMAVEACQILCTVAHGFGRTAPYKPTHDKHPCTVWAGQSAANFADVILLATSLIKEWAKRNDCLPSDHASWKVVAWCKEDWIENVEVYNFPHFERTRPPAVVPEEFRRDGLIESYRAFWQSKQRMVYRRAAAPGWYKPEPA